MTTRSSLKTEHAGAKNGGGYFGRRAQAKAESRRKRRHDDKAAVIDGDYAEACFFCGASVTGLHDCG